MEDALLRRPIRLVVTDDLKRSRLTVFVRLFLAIPHLFWVLLWTPAVFLVSFVMWLAVLIEARAPGTLHRFVASYVRYTTHLVAYLYLAANPYPGFTGQPGYPVDVEIDPPVRQSRLSAGFRLILAIPALWLAAVMMRGGFGYTPAIAAVCAFLGWFASLARGLMPRGLRDLTTYCIGYNAQAFGYALLLTGRYPSADPALVEPPQPLPSHPVTITVGDGLSRSRLTVFFRLLLGIPHIVWLLGWTVIAVPVALAAWLIALVIGRVPSPLHRFLAALVRYNAHVTSFLYLVGGPFPGFVGAAGSYPIDIGIDGPSPQRRLVTLFRLVLAIPAFFVASVLGAALFLVAVFGWWYALVRGRMPEGLRNLGAVCIRYSAQTSAYVWLLTQRYPYAGPALSDVPPFQEPALVPVTAGPPELEGSAEAELG